MTDTAWLAILCTISALGIGTTLGLIAVATRRKNRWWAHTEQAAHYDNPTFNPATELLRTNDLAHYAYWPANLGAVAAIIAIVLAPGIIQLMVAIAFVLLAIAAVAYAYTKRRQITAPSHKP